MKSNKPLSRIIQKISYKNINKVIFTELENTCLTHTPEWESINSAE